MDDGERAGDPQRRRTTDDSDLRHRRDQFSRGHGRRGEPPRGPAVGRGLGDESRWEPAPCPAAGGGVRSWKWERGSPDHHRRRHVRYQQIEGFGGSFTDSGAGCCRRSARIAGVDPHGLFDRDRGIGLSFLRQPIGASDFALSAYTYNESIRRAPTTRSRTFRSSTTAPISSRASRGAGGQPGNPGLGIAVDSAGVDENSRTCLTAEVCEPDAWHLRLYLVKFIQGYQAEGVPIDSLTVQNEPLTAPPYPSM